MAMTTADLTLLAQQAYNQAKLSLVDVPMAEDAKERTALQAAKNRVDQAIAEGQLTGYYSPVTGYRNNKTGEMFDAMPSGADPSLFTAVRGPSVATLGEQSLQAGTTMDALKLLGNLQADPFALERVARGMTATGIPKTIASVTGLIPQFGNYAAPNGPSRPISLDQLTGDIGLGTGDVMHALGGSTVGPGGAQGFNVDATLAGLMNGNPNKWNPQAYFGLNKDAQDFFNSANQAAGRGSGATTMANLQDLLPKFNTPHFGTVNLGG